ncbi:MAG TPA: hypothetical protein ENK02_05665 [Planctomycetes bacterium]|nr:hypothetical protein [Planctomycetota bacterium]
MSIELVTLILGLASISLVKEAIRSRAKTQLGRIQAELKRDLATRIQDPVLLSKVVDAKLPLKDLAEWVPLSQTVKAREQAPMNLPARPNPFFFFFGILGFVLGMGLGAGGFLASRYMQEDLWLAAAIVGSVGIAFLTFSIAHPQLQELNHQGQS